jgi:hypothetical protein
MRTLLSFLLLAALVACAASACAQEIPMTQAATIKVCPGAFPTDLTATDCRYSPKQRTLDFVAGSVTDQSVLGAAVFGLGAQIIQSPSEWKRTWEGYGRRVGSRYTQAVGKGAAQYLVGLILNDDPRFLAYRDDPGVVRRRRDAICAMNTRTAPNIATPCANPSQESLEALTHDGWQRFGHVWWDVITVRHSTIQGDGRRIPAFSRFAGEFGGAYAGYPWYPAAENTFPQVGERAAGAFGTAVLQSFYTEYKPEITNLLGAIFRRGSQPKSSAGGQP